MNDFELKEKKEGLVIKNADNPEEDSYQYDYTGKHDHDIVYEGYMKNNQKSGIGMKRFASKFVYYGFFNEDIMNGIGKVVLNNGDLFYGKFEKDNYDMTVINGYGEYFSLDKCKVFKGDFSSDNNKGEGVWYNFDDEDFEEDYNKKIDEFDSLSNDQYEEFDLTVLMEGLEMMSSKSHFEHI